MCSKHAPHTRHTQQAQHSQWQCVARVVPEALRPAAEGGMCRIACVVVLSLTHPLTHSLPPVWVTKSNRSDRLFVVGCGRCGGVRRLLFVVGLFDSVFTSPGMSTYVWFALWVCSVV